MSARTPAWGRATVEFALFTALTLVCIFTNRPLPIAALLGGISLAWRALRNLHTWPNFRLGWHNTLRARRIAPFASLLLLMLGVSALITVDADNTNTQLQRVLLGLSSCLAIRDWASINNRLPADTRRWVLQLALLGLGSALALASPFVVEWQGSKLPNLIPASLYQSFPLLTKDGANPNVMAGSLLILWPLALAPLLGWAKTASDNKSKRNAPQFADNTAPHPTPSRWEAAQGWAKRWRWLAQLFYGISALLIFSMLVLTQSRGAWLGAIAAIALLVNLRWRWARWISGGVMAVAILVVLAQPTLLGRLTELLSSGGNISGSAERIEIWTHAGYMIQDFSFTGVGMGNFRRVNDLFYPLYIAPADAPHAHNLFLQVAVDLGIPGLLAWAGLFGHSVVAAVRGYRRASNPTQRTLAAGLLAAQLALAVHGLLDCVVWGVMRTALVVWLLWGLALSFPSRSTSVPSSVEGVAPSPDTQGTA